MGRLRAETLERIEHFADRVLEVCHELHRQHCYLRVIDQLAGCGTSVGANLFEADEAMSRADFAKTLGIVVKELNETRFWLRLVVRQGWIPIDLLSPLLTEADELKCMFGAMISRTRLAKKN